MARTFFFSRPSAVRKNKIKAKQLVRKETLHPGASNCLPEPHKLCSFIEKRPMPKDLLDLLALLTAHHVTVAVLCLQTVTSWTQVAGKKCFYDVCLIKIL